MESLDNEEWTGLLSIAVAVLCYDPNKEQAFKAARQLLHDSKLSNFKKPSEALARVIKLHQDAYTAFGGEFMTSYDLFTLVRKKLNREVLHELDEVMATGDPIDHIEYDWLFIEDTVTTAWNRSNRRPEGYYDCILGEEKKSDTDSLNGNPLVNLVNRSR